MCHDPLVFEKENGPGVGFWISVGLGLAAGAFAVYLGGGILGFLIVSVVVAVGMGLLLS